MLKMEDGTGEEISSPSSLHVGPKDGDSGKELLRHLLKDKTSPVTKPTPTSQAPPTAHRQLSNESIRSEEEDMPGSCGNMVRRGHFRSHDLVYKPVCLYVLNCLTVFTLVHQNHQSVNRKWK